MTFNIPLGACEMSTTQTSDDNGSSIELAMSITSESRATVGTIHFGRSTVTVNIGCQYNAEIDIASPLALVETDTDVTSGTEPGTDPESLSDTFHINLYTSNFESLRNDTEPVIMGTKAHVGVSWDISSMIGKAKFMINECTIVQDGFDFEVDLVRRSCFLTLVESENQNAGKAVLVDQESRFVYRTFSFSESFDDADVELSCKIT